MANIILAEDDGSMREFLAKALRRAGHEVFDVGDGLDDIRHSCLALPLRKVAQGHMMPVPGGANSTGSYLNRNSLSRT